MESKGESKGDYKSDAGAKDSGGDIVKQVAELIYGDAEFGDHFERWVKGHAAEFDLDAPSDEHQLKYTALYQEYQGMFEDKVEGFLRDKGFSVHDFYDVLRTAMDDDPDGETAMFAQILRHVADYDIFIQMLREAAEDVERSARLGK